MMTSLGSQTVIYEDEVTALAGITVKAASKVEYDSERNT
jgi:hypothetical protein